MGQLTNQFVSQSYQGLFNLENANTGVTSTLQYVTDGIGNRLPMLASTSSIVITGSFRGDGSGLTGVTTTLPSGVVSGSVQIVDLGFATTSSLNTLSGSIASTDLGQNNRLTSLEQFTGSIDTGYVSEVEFGNYTSSMNSFTSSIDGRVDALEIETGSLQNQINGLATTGSLSGYTTITTFNNYTSSNDSKVNSLIAGTGSYATTSSLSAVSQSIATTDLNQNNRLGSLESKTGSYATTGSNQFNGNQSISGSVQASSTITGLNGFVGPSYGSTVNATIYGDQLVDIKTQTTSNNGKVRLYSNGNYPFKVEVSGSLNVRDGITGSLQGTASYATQALSASWAPDNSNRNGLITTGSIGGTQYITGSLNVEGTISATSASFTYVNTVYETASVIYSSGSNQLGDASNDTQTLYGTVNLPNGPLTITGSLRQSGTFYPDVIDWYSSSIQQGTGSYVLTTDALGVTQYDSYQNVASALQPFISGSTVASASYALNATSASHAINADTASYVLNAVSSSHSEYSDDAGLLNGTGSGVFATTGSNIFLGTETITGSINVSGSANFVGDISLNLIEPNDFKQNLVLLGGKNPLSSSTVLNNYLNAVTTSLDNDDVNFGLIPGGGLVPATGISTITGSIFISGSNNFILNLASQTPASQGRRGIIGNANFVQSSVPGINTSSLTIPAINNNYFGSSLNLTLTTGSNLGNNAHAFNSNILLGAGMTFNHPSASIGAGVSTNVSANLNIGLVTSNASGSLLTTQTSFNNNLNLHPGLVLNHISSSISSTNNFFIGGAAMSINNRYFTTGSNNSVAVSANILTGQNTVVNLAGSPSTNVSRTLVGNLVGGQNNNLSLEQTGTDLGGLRNSVVFGHNLNVTGSHSAAGAAQGAAFLGRYNGEDNGLADSARTILAVGTGTGASNRRTGFYITSGSLVGVSGSMDIKGTTNALVVTGSQTIQHSIAGQSALTVIAQGSGQPAVSITGSLNVSGSGDHTIVGNTLRVVGQTQMSGNSDFPLYVSGTIQTQRLHFDGNPFNTNPSSNLGAIRLDGNNQTFYSTMYDFAQITTQSLVGQTVITGSNLVKTSLQSSNGGTDAYVDLINSAGTRTLDVKVDAAVITGSLNVTGSVTIANAGDLTMYGHKMFNAGEFWSNTTQSGSAGVSGSLNFDASGSAVGVSLVSGSRLTVANGGTYNIQFSAQFETSAGADTGYVWFKKNGTNIGDSATKVVLANNTAQVMTVNILDEASANDYYELGYQFTNGNATVLAEAASGNIPAIPSVIATVTQAR